MTQFFNPCISLAHDNFTFSVYILVVLTRLRFIEKPCSEQCAQHEHPAAPRAEQAFVHIVNANKKRIFRCYYHHRNEIILHRVCTQGARRPVITILEKYQLFYFTHARKLQFFCGFSRALGLCNTI